MIYIVKYMYVYDDYKDAGASSSILGIFSDEAAAHKCAVQKYSEEIVAQLSNLTSSGVPDYTKLTELLVGTPQEMFTALDTYRDTLFVPEFTRSRIGPMISIQSQETFDSWDLQSYLATAPFAEATEVEVDAIEDAPIQFQVQFEGRVIRPCDEAITNWLTTNNKDRLKTDLPRDLFIPGFQIDETFYPLPSEMVDYALRSCKVGVGAKRFGCSWILGEYLDDYASSEYAPYEADSDAYYALPEAVQEAHLWWTSFEDQGAVLDEVLWNVTDVNGLPEPSSDCIDLGKQMVVNACDC